MITLPHSVTNPTLVYTKRGSLVENYHRGAYVVVDRSGEIIAAAGHFKEMIFARSCLKPINVLAMIVSGAADHFHVSDLEIALACASHNGEEAHVKAVESWLKRIGCTSNDLECGIHAPMGQEARRQLQARGEQPTMLHNACSGKHTGFLTLTQFLGESPQNYTNIDHPTQQAIMKTAAQVLGLQVNETPKGIDGCRIPMMGMPMIQLAYGMAKLADPYGGSDPLDKPLQEACERVVKAMQAYPFYVGGTRRFCSDVIEKTQGQIIVKMGADGVFSAIVPQKKWGIALKIDDGHLQGAEMAMIHLLRRLKLLAQDDLFQDWMQQPLYNWAKEEVGHFYSAF